MNEDHFLRIRRSLNYTCIYIYLGKAFSGVWFFCSMFLIQIYQSSVRSSLLIINYNPEVNNMRDAATTLNLLHSPFIKLSDSRSEEEYITDSIEQYGPLFSHVKQVVRKI